MKIIARLLITLILLLSAWAVFAQDPVIKVYKEDGQYKSTLDFPIGKYPVEVIVDSTNFWKPTPKPPDPPDPIPSKRYSVGPNETYKTIQQAAGVCPSGDTVWIRAGTYRETITPTNSQITFINYPGEIVVVSGLNQVNSPWTVHSGQIYRTSITLPVNGFQLDLTSNTTILANQIFKDGVMQPQARWPKISTPEDMIDRNKYRHHSQTAGIGYKQLTDNGLPAGNFTGASIWITGWFISESRTITSHSGKTLGYSDLRAQNGNKFQKWYYITNDLELLTQAKEWHYQNGTLYFWQENGGLPSGVEYKARNWGFDLRGKSGTKIIGLHFIGCEPATGDTGTNNTVIDNIRAKYTNHAFMTATNGDFNYYNAKQTGIKLLGSNNTIKNSEFRYVASQGIWATSGTVVENNLFQDWGWEGNYGAPVGFWGNNSDGTKILWNTAYRLGRSSVDFGHGTHKNIEIGYNEFHTFSMVTSDVGAIYGCCGVNIAGTRIHHNWIHDNMVRDGWKNGANYDGIHTNIYFDQGAGPATVDHNVMWNGGVADLYSQIEGVMTNIYNNTFGTTSADYSGRESYFCPHLSPSDVQRNNIYRNIVNIVWHTCNSNDNANQPGDVANSIFYTTDPKFVGPVKTGLGYKLENGSPAINAGTTISGITDGSIGAPDAGAYEYGAPDWIPGYKSKAPEPPSSGTIINNTQFTFTGTGWVHAADQPWTVAPTHSVSYCPTINAEASYTFTGTKVELYAEKRNNHGNVEVYIDNVKVADVNLFEDITTNNSQKVWTSATLPAGSHIFKVKFVGPADKDITLDYIKVY